MSLASVLSLLLSSYMYGDFRLNIYQNTEKQWRIDISTTVYIVGKNAANKVKDYNAFIEEYASKLQGTYLANNTNYTVSVKIEYKEGGSGIKSELKGMRSFQKRIPLSSGDNLLDLSEEPIRSYVMPKGGYYGELGSSEYFSSPAMALHETLHFLGLGDRYTDNENKITVPDKGFENDIMASTRRGWVMSQIHFDNLAKKMLEIWDKAKVNDEIGTMTGTVDNPSKDRVAQKAGAG